MKRASKILAGVLILGVVILAYMVHRENNRAEFFRTEPMRKARHKRPGQTEPEEGEQKPEVTLTEEERILQQQPIV